MFHFIIGLLFSAIHVPVDFEAALSVDVNTLKIDDLIEVETECYGVQTGRVDRIVESPFYGQEGQYVAYVVSLEDQPLWTSYVVVS